MAAAKKTKLNSVDTGKKTGNPRSSAAKGREKVTVKSERSSSKKTIAKKKSAPPKTENNPTAEIKDKRQSHKKTVSKKSTLASKFQKKYPDKKGAVAKVIASIKKAVVKKSTNNKKSVSVKKTAIKETSTKKTQVKKTAAKKTISKSKPVVSKSASVKKTAKSKSTKISRNSKNQQSKQMIVFPTSTWEADSVISFEATEQLTAPDLTSISGGFVFHGDNIVLANIPGRGWDIIGGRIDLGESPEETFRREASSQIGVNLSHLRMLGAIRIEHLGEKPPNCPYPFPIGYGIQYIGIVEELLPFTGSGESLGRSLISREGFKEHYHDWNEYYEAIFNYACKVYDKWRKKLKI